MKLVFITLLMVLLFFPIRQICDAQVLPFRHYTIRDGLLSNSINTLAQDSRGYLWIGTSEGISIFDGITFKNYTIENGLPGGLVRAIVERKERLVLDWNK